MILEMYGLGVQNGIVAPAHLLNLASLKAPRYFGISQVWDVLDTLLKLNFRYKRVWILMKLAHLPDLHVYYIYIIDINVEHPRRSVSGKRATWSQLV